VNVCPKCGGRDFRIQVTFSGSVCIQLGADDPDEFEVTDSEPTDSEWTNDSDVTCLDCDWSGMMKEIDPEKKQEEKNVSEQP
jgi:hypothetical protein